jgi:hypothetical protein
MASLVQVAPGALGQRQQLLAVLPRDRTGILGLEGGQPAGGRVAGQAHQPGDPVERRGAQGGRAVPGALRGENLVPLAGQVQAAQGLALQPGDGLLRPVWEEGQGPVEGALGQLVPVALGTTSPLVDAAGAQLVEGVAPEAGADGLVQGVGLARRLVGASALAQASRRRR